MSEDKKTSIPGQLGNSDRTPKKAWQPMKLTVAGEAKDVIRHGVNKTSPGTGDPGEVQKVPSGAEH
jgi:hypothetical protein